MTSSRWQNVHLYRRPSEDYQTYSPLNSKASNATDSSNDDIDDINSFYSMAIDSQLLNCFVHLPVQESLPFQLDFRSIAEAQAQDTELTQLRQSKPQQYVQQAFSDNTQYALSHPGSTRLKDTIRIHFHNPKLSNTIEDFTSKCDTCQRHKALGRGHGHTAPKEAPLVPWRQVAVDPIGPWKITVAGQEIEFKALTVIDLVTNLVEIIRLKDKTSEHVTLQFENVWLARYPRPATIIHDQGGEFTGFPFQSHLLMHGIDPRSISSKNPQANAVCGRMHQTIGNSLRVLSAVNQPWNTADAEQLVDTAIANAVFAHRSSYHGTIASTPGSLAFNHGMILDLPIQADFQLIQERRQHLIDKELLRASHRRFAYDYQPGDQVLKIRYNPKKLDPRADGPYPVVRVHTNGTLTIRTAPHVTEHISLRRLKPYRQ